MNTIKSIILISILSPFLSFGQNKSECTNIYKQALETINQNKESLLQLLNTEQKICFHINKSLVDYKGIGIFYPKELDSILINYDGKKDLASFYDIENTNANCSKESLNSLSDCKNGKIVLSFSDICWKYNFLTATIKVKEKLFKDSILPSQGRHISYLIMFNDENDITNIVFKSAILDIN